MEDKLDFGARGEPLSQSKRGFFDCGEKDGTVTADIFCKRLDGDVDTMSEGVEVNPGRPGVVEDDESTRFVGDFGDGGDVLDFHGDGAWAFAPDEACVSLEE